MSSSKATFGVVYPENALAQCITLNLSRPRQGVGLERFDVSFELFCGTQPLGQGLHLGVKQCRIVMHLEGCALERGSSYNYNHQHGKVQEKSKRDSAKESDVELGVEAEVGAGLIKGVLASLKVNARGGAKSKKKQIVEKEVQPRLPLISFEGGNCWVVGEDGVGDLRNPGGLLRGDYFNEVRDGEGSPVPACWLGGYDGYDAATVTIGAVVRMGDLTVVEADKEPDDEMKARIAGMMVLKRYKRQTAKLASGLRPEQVIVSIGKLTGRISRGE